MIKISIIWQIMKKMMITSSFQPSRHHTKDQEDEEVSPEVLGSWTQTLPLCCLSSDSNWCCTWPSCPPTPWCRRCSWCPAYWRRSCPRWLTRRPGNSWCRPHLRPILFLHSQSHDLCRLPCSLTSSSLQACHPWIGCPEPAYESVTVRKWMNEKLTSKYSRNWLLGIVSNLTTFVESWSEVGPAVVVPLPENGLDPGAVWPVQPGEINSDNTSGNWGP